MTYGVAGLSDDERRRLDAAERLIEQRFNVRADLYYRANEQPGASVKLTHVIDVLVLDRSEWENPEFAERRYSFTRDQLIAALTHLEVHLMVSGPLAGKVVADQFADTLIEALEREQS